MHGRKNIKLRVPCFHGLPNFTLIYNFVLLYREMLEKGTADFCDVTFFNLLKFTATFTLQQAMRGSRVKAPFL